MNEPDEQETVIELSKLSEENARLKSLLKAHGIAWEKEYTNSLGDEISQPSHSENIGQHLTPKAKVELFRKVFRGRNDVYAVRWQSAKGKSGYSPACGNEWRPGVCGKPQVKCGDCDHRSLLPLIDKVIYDHLAGFHTIGIYPLLSGDGCYFIAADFDDDNWRDDARAFMQSCRELGVTAALEISRSGLGAHVWIFFSEEAPAREARRLGSALISYTCARTRQLSLKSYDRLFPNQDTLPKGGFGNLIALPLQKKPREQGRSVFVNERFEPFPDQWAFLASLTPMIPSVLESLTQKATPGGHPLDVAFVVQDDECEPWKRRPKSSPRLLGQLPASLNLVLANQIFIEKACLPHPLANRLIRLAAFQNPEFHKAQAMRLPVWNKPRIICCAENYPQHIGLPRGCRDSVLELLSRNGITPELKDERLSGVKITAKFLGELRSDQTATLNAMISHENGILCAPTASGKTVIAAALISKRQVQTLILVHRTDLLKQWQERMKTFLEISEDGIGVIGAGKMKPSWRIDIAVMQSLGRRDDLPELLDHYEQIIVDECHHLSAFSFESILKKAKARHVVGLTATPERRDGCQPIIFMQCGPISP